MRKTFLALAALLASSSAWADTLVTNVNGVQVDSRGELERFTGLIISDDGKVKRVLRGEMLKLRDTQVIDARGRTMLPGLIDAHGHVVDAPGGDIGLGLLVLRLDLTGTQSVSEVTDRLSAYARANPGSSWILGRGWNEELWTAKQYPTAADLDAVVSDRPVLLARVDGHAAVANSAALKAAGLTASTPEVPGGRIDRFPDGTPTGVLVDNAISLVAGHAPPPTDEMLVRALEAAQQILLANGITSVGDMGSSRGSWQAMNSLAAAGRLKIRIVSYFDGLRSDQPIPVSAPTEWLYEDRLRMVGLKIYTDGALGSRGAWLKQPYADKPDTKGLNILSDQMLLDQADRAAGAGFQVAIHAIGDAALAQAITTFEAMNKKYPGDRRWRIEHFQIADPADIPRLKPAGIIASMQPTHQTSDRLMAEKRLGPDRLKGAYAWQTVEKLGIPIAFGSDFPVESPNPFPGLAAAVSRQDMNGQPPGGWIPEERVTFEQALHGFTRGAAHAGFAEDKIGSLEPGKWADFIIVDRDVSQADPQSLARTQVLETWVAGKKVWERARAPSVGAERGR